MARAHAHIRDRRGDGRARIVPFLVLVLLGTAVAALPALVLLGLLHLAGVQSGTSVPVLLFACTVVGVVHARRRIAALEHSSRSAD